MDFSGNLILSSSSITARSAVHSENMDLLARGAAFYRKEPLEIESFILGRHGKISDPAVAGLLDSFDIKPKNKKYFERSSILLFAAVKDYIEKLRRVDGDGIGLFCAVGPANARLAEFREWAAAIDENDEFYPPLMASSVIKLLPNIVMSNLSINAGWRGENAIFTSPAAPFCDALGSMLLSIEAGTLSIAAAASVSAPFEYFNIDSYTRFLAPSFFNAPLCEAAASLLCCSRDFYRENAPVRENFEPEGFIASIDRFKVPYGFFDYDDIASIGGKARSYLEKMNYDLRGTHHFAAAPSPAGNFLSAGEPLNISGLIHLLNKNGEDGYAVSATADYFGNLSVIKAGGRLAIK
jgi:hypothetical protein